MSSDRSGYHDFVAAHVASCDECRADETGATAQRIRARRANIERVLVAARPPIDRARLVMLSAAAYSAAIPLLEERARRVYGRRLLTALAIVIAPLPLVYIGAVWALSRLYSILSALTSEALATWAVTSYASLSVLAVALACAAVPLLVERTVPQVHHVPGRSLA